MQTTLKNNFMPYHSSMSANTISPCHTANYFSDAKQVVVLGAFRLQYFMLQQGNVYTTVINVSVDTSIAALVFGPCQLHPTGRSIHINHRLTASFCQPSLKAEHQDMFNNRAASLFLSAFMELTNCTQAELVWLRRRKKPKPLQSATSRKSCR